MLLTIDRQSPGLKTLIHKTEIEYNINNIMKLHVCLCQSHAGKVCVPPGRPRPQSSFDTSPDPRRPRKDFFLFFSVDLRPIQRPHRLLETLAHAGIRWKTHSSSTIQWCSWTLTLTVDYWKEFTNKTSDRYWRELNLLCCWQLSTVYTCNNFFTVSGACGWSTRGSIWPVLFVQLFLNTWCLS